jgi:hypothetical protein
LVVLLSADRARVQTTSIFYIKVMHVLCHPWEKAFNALESMNFMKNRLLLQVIEKWKRDGKKCRSTRVLPEKLI